MANTANPAVPATSAVAQAVETIGGKPVAEVESTIVDIGFRTFRTVKAMDESKQSLETLDVNLHDWVKDITYPEFMKVRDIYMTGAVDAGAAPTYAQKLWENQISRLSSNMGFMRPKSESKDAERKAKAKAEQVAKLAEFGDGELVEKRDALVAKGDVKSLNAAKVFAAELERRNEGELKAERANRKSIVETINKRVKELAKAETADADAILAAVAAMLV